MTARRPDLRPGDALLIVDVQRDFCPGGDLPIADGDAIVPVLNRWIEAARAAGVPVYASRDWHPDGHCSFSNRGGPWPIHCRRGTPGAAFHPELALPEDMVIVSKGTERDRDAYSAFDGTGLAARLRAAGVRRLWIGGLAQDVCVKATVLDALSEGFHVNLIESATAPVDIHPGDGARALEEMAGAGAVLVPDGVAP